MTQTVTPRKGLLDIPLYVAGAAKAGHANRIIKLSSNENPFGPSERVKEAFAASGAALERYPDSGHLDLRSAIGAVHGLDPARIICGAGSDEVFTFLCQAYAGEGAEVIHTEHGFAMHKICAQAAGATPVEVAERERCVDVDAILAACTDRTKIIFIANPANPTGTLVPEADLVRLADAIPAETLLVIDGAYAEYVRDPDYNGGKALATTRHNVVMTRTFSKIYGIGALRVGWGYGPQDVIDALNRVRGPFNLTGPAIAGAIAAVQDQDYVQRCSIENEVWRDWMTKELRGLGLSVDPSHANFVLARFADVAAAQSALEALTARGILVRNVASYGLPSGLRITVGTPEECRDTIAALRQIVGMRT
ncbi:histidinol-phosphate aminotransferase [Rubricella aquisinus]|uniref:Histidinol-phosphate aminotransferase n=1 Tax=Rubricella aquisinus TaxID=2028108 RepID=A0A840WKX4_9RHOB|nr:histidinol-phosphate transaminase [Rubricella aquisinus]MBB5514312.1 histidinol-phosphate aminotransferase [Rubricella aquisinus]